MLYTPGVVVCVYVDSCFDSLFFARRVQRVNIRDETRRVQQYGIHIVRFICDSTPYPLPESTAAAPCSPLQPPVQ